MARPRAGVTFWDRVESNSEPDGDCTMFRGHLNEDGYGRIHKDGRLVFVHREVWIKRNGEIPKGLCVCHTCDRPACINPAHLWLGTHKDNMADRKRKGRDHVAFGSASPVAKLKEADIPAIRLAYASGETATAIAFRYGVSDGTVRSISKRRIWKHVP